jgi:hypothetical protein
MKNDPLFIERQGNGQYAVKRPNQQRASAVLDTQADAIQRAREMSPAGPIHVERVRNTNSGSPDKWRKI